MSVIRVQTLKTYGEDLLFILLRVKRFLLRIYSRECFTPPSPRNDLPNLCVGHRASGDTIHGVLHCPWRSGRRSLKIVPRHPTYRYRYRYLWPLALGVRAPFILCASGVGRKRLGSPAWRQATSCLPDGRATATGAQQQRRKKASATTGAGSCRGHATAAGGLG